MQNSPENRVLRVRTDLGPLAVEVRGQGPALVLWHSLFVNRRSFDGVIHAFTKDHQVIAIDAPDHGESPGPDGVHDYDLDDCADAALAVLDALEVESADWVGHAFGGHVGAVLAARRSGRLRSLAAIAAPMQPVDGRARLRALMVLLRLIGVRGPVAAGLVDAMLDPSKRDTACVEQLLAMARTPERASLLRAMRSVMLERPSLVDRLHRIDVPTLFVTGDDPIWPLELARAHAAPIPRSRVEHLPSTRHMQPLEDPEGLLAVLGPWLEGVGTGAIASTSV